MSKKQKSLAEMLAEIGKSRKGGVLSLSDEQRAELDEALDCSATIGKRTIAAIASEKFGVHISRSSLAEYDHKRRAASAANR